MNAPNYQVQQTVSDRSVLKKTLFAFVLFALFMSLGWATFRWIRRQPAEAGALKPLRKGLLFNERVFSAVFDSTKLVKEYPVSKAVKRVRVNGMYGLRGNVDVEGWRLKVVRQSGDTLQINLDDIRKLPKKELVFDFKCIEGWDQVTHWGGVPL